MRRLGGTLWYYHGPNLCHRALRLDRHRALHILQVIDLLVAASNRSLESVVLAKVDALGGG